MSQQAQPVVIARQTVAFSRQSDLWDGLIPKTIVAYRVDDLRDLPLIERKRRLRRMTDHTPISKVSRLEVVSTGARRRWTLDEKQRIVAESYGGSRLVSVTARRNGLSTSQLFTWRRLAREGRLGGDAVPALVPVEITSTPAPASTCAPQPPSSPACAACKGRNNRDRAWRRLSRSR